MSPIFSVHPDLSDEAWYRIRKMLEEHDLLSKLKIKSSSSEILSHTFTIFQNDISGYILWGLDYDDDQISKLRSVGFDSLKCKGIIEIMLKNGDEKITTEIVKG